MRALLLFGREYGVHLLDRDSILLFDPVHQVIRFRKQEFGVDGKKAEVFAGARSHIDQHHPFGAERRRHGYAFAEGLERPGQSMLRCPILGRVLNLCDLLLDVDLDLVFHASGSSFGTKSAAAVESANNAAGRTPSFSAEMVDINGCARATGSAKRTTSPTISSVGAASFGERCNPPIVEKCVCCCAVVAREMMAQGVSQASPDAFSFAAISP